MRWISSRVSRSTGGLRVVAALAFGLIFRLLLLAHVGGFLLVMADLGVYINLALAAGEALTALVSDRARLVTWSRGDMRIDYDRLRKDIADVAAHYLSQGRSEVGGAKTDNVGWEEVV